MNTSEAMSDTLKRAEELLEGITPGDWKVDQRSGCVAVYPATEDHNCLSGLSESAIHYSAKGASFDGNGWDMDAEAKANAAFIAAAPSLVRELVAEVKALREENATLRTTLSGRTYCHSDEAVNAELTSLRRVVEKVREYANDANVNDCGSGDFLLSLISGVTK